MRKKIPCKVIESVPLTICYPIVYKDVESFSCGDDLRIKKNASTCGAYIYTSRLNITNISDNANASVPGFDAYF
jgi:hypothetical protein